MKLILALDLAAITYRYADNHLGTLSRQGDDSHPDCGARDNYDLA